MLNLLRQPYRFCDKMPRRSFLQIGGLAMGGLTLADLFRAEAAGGAALPAKPKSIINVYLHGGPSHLDMFDLKPDAPAEIRGQYKPIATNVPGMLIAETLPHLARMGDKLAILRSVSGMANEHDPTQSDSGWSYNSLRSIGGRPGVGSIISKVQGPTSDTVPAHISLTKDREGHRVRFGDPGFLGALHGPLQVDGDGRRNLSLHPSISLDRFQGRTQLLGALNRVRDAVEQQGIPATVDSFNERALGVITSGKLVEALDYKREAPRVLDRYGIAQRDDAFTPGTKVGRYSSGFLMARRLVEAGVRCVSFFFGRSWDTHDHHFPYLEKLLPPLDRGLSALIEDLEMRGMLDDTIILVSGEFGRTPRINKLAGRDHWPNVMSVLMAGGGLRTGQVIGKTDRLAQEATERKMSFQCVFATLYRQLGIPLETTLIDPNGRPQYLLDDREPIPELI